MTSKPTPPDLAALGLEEHVTLPQAAKLLGVAHVTLLNRLNRRTIPELRAKKILGRWRVPISAIKALYGAEDAAKGKAVADAVFRQVDYPHFRPVAGRGAVRARRSVGRSRDSGDTSKEG